MKLAEIKAQIGIEQLTLNTATDIDGNPTDWMRHWDNENRVAVSIHRETVERIKANLETDQLSLQTETRKGSQGDYTSHRIVMYKAAEETL